MDISLLTDIGIACKGAWKMACDKVLLKRGSKGNIVPGLKNYDQATYYQLYICLHCSA